MSDYGNNRFLYVRMQRAAVESSRGKLACNVLMWLGSVRVSGSEDAKERKARAPGTAKPEHVYDTTS